jgi:hypothetical protein
MKDKIINGLREIYKKLKSILYHSFRFNVSLILLIVILPSIYYLHLFDTGHVYKSIPRIFIITSLLIIFFSIIIIVSELEKNKTFSEYFDNTFNLFTFLKIVGMYFIAFVLFLLSFHFLKYISYHSTNFSIIITSIILIASLGILYEKIYKSPNNSNNNNNGLLTDILFYIPCLVLDIFDFVRNEYRNIPSNTVILSYIIIGLLLVIYVLPILIDYIKGKQSLKLVKGPKVLEDNIIELNNDDIKERILESRPFYQKYLIEKNNELTNKMKQFKTNMNTNNSTLNIFSKRRIYYDSPIDYTYAMDIPYCINKDIICEDDNLKCVDKKDNSNSTDIINYHGMKEKCSKNINIFESMYGNLYNKTLFYKDNNKNNHISIKEYCNISNSEPICISPLDISNTLTNYNNLTNTNTKRFMCKKDNSYNIIYGYVDNCDNIVDFKCNNPLITEGFTDNLHTLDMLIENDDYLKGLTSNEKEILHKSLENSDSNTLNILENIKNPEEIKEFLAVYLSNNENYYGLLENIKKYNSEKNEFIYQETSKLIQYINRTNQIYDYNYHYGLSFWIYFDPIILTNNPPSKKGFIMSYSNNPTIYYDYDNNSLNITITDCENEYKKCTNVEVYKSSDILYNKWNHIVVNYNYGTLDVFINNNLVFTKANVSPYIEKTKLEIGKKTEPLYNCAICNFIYNEKPLNLIDIKKIYSKKENPCN